MVSGSSGCNLYSAEYTSRNRYLSLSSTMFTTLMLCIPESIMDLEDRFLRALRSVRTYQIVGGHLILRDARGRAVARFIHPSCLP